VCPVPVPPPAEAPTSDANRGVLFTHTYFRQMAPGKRAFLCAGRAAVGSCPCCAPLPEPADGTEGGEVAAGAYTRPLLSPT
jgi:hypothetical protein